ncbi:hypothetical protein D0817_05125 [Flavobacterium cupreum]|uniref:Fibronectin type-III domain-containing protein n=1 Tax=Flavobacterium cupreum TaxID=2133766 RepID=A0A434AA60_9FLAO|nr:hypothetical protein [Flavobacterium cupreum]RUT71265.1 hypothetical protein D0817_05125 [Flavobacterium cupreum]
MKKFQFYTFLSFIFFLSLFSCEEILIVDDISKEEITLIAPANNSVLFSTGASFSWNSIENAEKYRLQIAKPNFANPIEIVLDTLIAKTSYTQQMNIGKYEWRVKAVNSGYETPYKSSAFEILNNEDFQNNTVVLLSPGNNLITKNAIQKLTWQTIIGASEYQLQIYDSTNEIVKENSSASTSFDYIFPDGNFSWKVRASNGTKETLYTTRKIVVDTKVPNTPVLANPADKSTTTATDINFQYSRTPMTGSVEKDSIYVYTESALTNLKFKEQVTSPYTKTLTSGSYYWYILSFDQAGNKSNKSNVFSFTIN